MTKEDEQLLLQDLCARLPYRTIVKCNTDYRHEFNEELSVMHIMNFYQFEIKAYLRPMSSMTEEEYEMYEYLNDNPISGLDRERLSISLLDWLNKHHFDYRGLIEKGLALEALDGMYNLKEK